MSATAVKHMRRDIRRAVGADALGLIDAHTQILDDTVIPRLNNLLARTDDLRKCQKSCAIHCEQRSVTTDSRIETIETVIDAWQALTFTQRLRWLLRGRA